ncbi:unnamed protein product [Effrenium voratum]|uniref:Ubiquitin-like domain-containing protein n=1 Tax=Effrenium voratum TaxID=2562239 RepID=A0AA36HL77_9DINO|nr:unnamed protein product [Effrenium voratum]CAJ1449636.1 unnamed protein product [Effrenium voratum]
MEGTDAKAQAEPEVLVLARTLGGRELEFRLPGHEQVSALRRRVAKSLKAPHATLRLVHQGDTLQDTSLLSSFGSELEVFVVKTPGQESDYRLLFKEFAQAVESGRQKEARDLLDQGAGHDAEGRLLFERGSNALHLAVRAQLQELALYLIQQGTDLEAKNEMGRTALMQACIKNSEQVVAALLAARAEVNGKDRSSKPALYYAFKTPAIVKMLMDAGPDEADVQQWSYLLEQEPGSAAEASAASRPCGLA